MSKLFGPVYESSYSSPRYRGKTLYGRGTEGVQRGGDPNALRRIMEQMFMPELEARRGKGEQLWRQWQDVQGAPLGSLIQPQLEEMGSVFSQKMLEPGGEIAGKFQAALGGSVRQGFDPTATGATGQARIGLQSEFTDRLSQYMTGASAQLMGQELGYRGQLGQAAMGYDEVLASMFPSLFTGAAAAENLEFQKWALLKQL
jgi:hypothetical protein